MSSTTYRGSNAGFYYTEFGGTTWKTYQLAVPLYESRASWRCVQYSADSLDVTRRQVFTVTHTTNAAGNMGAHEYLGVIRYDNDPVGLEHFLRNAMILSGSTTYPVRYTTALTTGTTAGAMGAGADVWLIEPSAPVMDFALDRQRATFGDQEVVLRLRSMSAAQQFSTGSGARWF